MWLESCIFISKVSGSNPLSGFKVDLVFHHSEVGQASPSKLKNEVKRTVKSEPTPHRSSAVFIETLESYP